MNTHPKFEPGDRVVIQTGKDVQPVAVVAEIIRPDGIMKTEYQYSMRGDSERLYYTESELETYVEPNAMDRHAEKLRQEFLNIIGYEGE